MSHIYEGTLDAKSLKFAIVVSRFNPEITKKLLARALECFKQQGVLESDITIAWVPGAFEIPLIAKTCSEMNKFDAIVCLGALIRGETYHFELIADQVAEKI